MEAMKMNRHEKQARKLAMCQIDEQAEMPNRSDGFIKRESSVFDNADPIVLMGLLAAMAKRKRK